MKTTKTILKLAVAGCMVIFFSFQSCRKDEQTIANHMETTNGIDPSLLSVSENDIFSNYTQAEIDTFLVKMHAYHNSALTDNMKLADVYPLILLGINYTFSDLSQATNNQYLTTPFSISITPDANNQVLLSEVSAKMHQMGNYIREKLDSATGTVLITVGIKPIPGTNDEFDVEFLFGVIETPPAPGQTADNCQWDRIVNPNCYKKAPNEIQFYGRKHLIAKFEYFRTHTYYGLGKAGYLVGTYDLNNGNWILPSMTQNIGNGMPGFMINGYAPSIAAIFEINEYASVHSINGYELCIPYQFVNYYISKVDDVFDYLKPNNTWPIASLFVVETERDKKNILLRHKYKYGFSRLFVRPISPYLFM
ncbi:MAG: hypothetical protein ACK566_09625 [Bacteroidota bacterium]